MTTVHSPFRASVLHILSSGVNPLVVKAYVLSLDDIYRAPKYTLFGLWALKLVHHGRPRPKLYLPIQIGCLA